MPKALEGTPAYGNRFATKSSQDRSARLPYRPECRHMPGTEFHSSDATYPQVVFLVLTFGSAGGWYNLV
jgi:hypothetical protein